MSLLRRAVPAPRWEWRPAVGSEWRSVADGGPIVTCSSGAMAMSDRPLVHGYEIYFENAMLTYESSTCPLTLLTADGKTSPPELPGGVDPISACTMEIQAAVDGAAASKAPDLLSGKLTGDALVMCYKKCESVKSGKIVALA